MCEPTAPSDSLNIVILHHGRSQTFAFSASSTIIDLAASIEKSLSIPSSSQRFLITPKIGLLKPPFSGSLALSALQNKKIQLLAATPTEIAALSTAAERISPKHLPSSSLALKSATPARNRDWRKAQDAATYSFHTLIPLPYLPDPSRSLRYLERLRDDAGIRASMIKHKFSVGVLTEMNPAEHTTHESRTLGLNRNRGEVIELRLRTDAYDGYRDYKTIRKTLCHELAHNVWGDHDRNFWDLCKEIEREVEQNDWRSGGHALSNEEFYSPSDVGDDLKHVDGGGWTGGEFVLGSVCSLADGSFSTAGSGLTRRELMAKAAEERMKRQKSIDGDGDGAGGSS